MKTDIRFGSRVALATAGTLLVAVGVVTVRAKADVWDKKTVFSVNQPIQVQETYLEPGTYVFKLHNSSSNRHIVQIYNRDENRLINTVMATPNYRLQPTDGSRFTFYETPPGTARAMRAWFYPGDNYGQEFTYPKQLRHIAMAVPPKPPPSPIVTQPAEPANSALEPQAATEPPPREKPELIARNNPEPQAPKTEPATAPAPPKHEEPADLPKTATSFPLIGFGGLLSLVAFGLMRSNRQS
jgi:hypothetical protein